jgi:hypothetical protein
MARRDEEISQLQEYQLILEGTKTREIEAVQ